MFSPYSTACQVKCTFNVDSAGFVVGSSLNWLGRSESYLVNDGFDRDVLVHDDLQKDKLAQGKRTKCSPAILKMLNQRRWLRTFPRNQAMEQG